MADKPILSLAEDEPLPPVEVPKARKAKPTKAPPKSPEQISLEEKLERPNAKQVRAQILKKFGGHAIAGYDRPMPKINVIPTGYSDLDHRCIGGGNPLKGGIPRGLMTEISGKESSGKSTFCLSVLGNAQRRDNAHVVYIDLEHTVDTDYAKILGVNTEAWDYCYPMDGDEAVEIFLMWAAAGVDMIVLDSVGELDPKEDVEKDLDENLKVAGAVHLVKRLLVKCAKPMIVNQTAGILINQMRAIMNAKAFQKKDQTTGGNRLHHRFALRIEVSKGERITHGDKIVGIDIGLHVLKNKLGQPFAKTSLPLLFKEGISRHTLIMTEAIKLGIIEGKSGNYTYCGSPLVRGKDKLLQMLKDQPDFFKEIETKCAKTALGSQDDVIEGPDEAPEDMAPDVEVDLE